MIGDEELKTASLEDILDEYDRLTEVLQDLDQEGADRKAEWERFRVSVVDNQTYRERRAEYAEYKAEVAAVRRDTLDERSRLSKEMRNRQLGETGGLSPRGQVRRLAEAIMKFEEDDDMTEEDLFEVLDTTKVWAKGRQVTVREFYEDLGGEWE